MTNDSEAIRTAGISILRNLANNAEPGDKKLILDMVDDFSEEETQTPGGKES